MARLQKGFTLVEVMVVIAIIGILASFALPSYRDYVTKANGAEALALLNQLAKKATLYYNVNRSWPTSTAQMAAFDGSISANEADTRTDVVHSHHFNANHVPAGQGAVWVRLMPRVFADDGNVRHLRAVLTDQGGSIKVDHCDQVGAWATEPDIFKYFDC